VAAQAEPHKLPGISRNFFITLLLLIVGAAILCSAIATRLEGFAIDEPYHITAGVLMYDTRIFASIRSILRSSNFGWEASSPRRGSISAAFAHSLTRPTNATFTEQVVYLNNDFNSVQRRSRLAMWMLAFPAT
jgi:hypothetical protein